MSKRPAPVDALVGRNIRNCRVQRGLSQAELGERVGVSFQQIQKYEKGATRVGASRLTLIAEALGVPVPALFKGGASANHAGGDPFGRPLLTNSGALRLAQAFDRIPRTPMRLAILHLIEALAESPLNRGPSRRGKRATRQFLRRVLM